MALSGLDARAQECLAIERAVRSGQSPKFRPWLQEELIRAHPHDRSGWTKRASGHERNGAADKLDPEALPIDPIVATGWATAFPHAPDSPWLPPAPPALVHNLALMDLDLDEDALRWVRWACLHRSYLYESVPDSPINGEALDLLSTVGRSWMRMALLELTRSLRGDFTSNTEVAGALSVDGQARAALAAWVNTSASGFFGKGEASLLASGSKSHAPEIVALQILGGLVTCARSCLPIA